MMRVVFDTNLVVSGLLWSGAPRQALNIAAAKQVTAITSEALVEEYLTYTSVIEPASVPGDAVPDIDDVIVLEAAVGGKANCIASGDDDLLSLNSYAGIPILSVRAFIQRKAAGNARIGERGRSCPLSRFSRRCVKVPSVQFHESGETRCSPLTSPPPNCKRAA